MSNRSWIIQKVCQVKIRILLTGDKNGVKHNMMGEIIVIISINNNNNEYE